VAPTLTEDNSIAALVRIGLRKLAEAKSGPAGEFVDSVIASAFAHLQAAHEISSTETIVVLTASTSRSVAHHPVLSFQRTGRSRRCGTKISELADLPNASAKTTAPNPHSLSRAPRPHPSRQWLRIDLREIAGLQKGSKSVLPVVQSCIYYLRT